MLQGESDDSPRHLCYGCGSRNPEGLHIHFEVEGRRVTGRFTARETHVGYPGVAHGGIAASVLDEAMGWAMYAAGAWAMTARMEVKYRKPLPLEREVTVTAEVVRERGRVLDAVAQIRGAGGAVLAEAKAMFVRIPREKQGEMERFYRGTEPAVPG
jgi:uncharacterized protein (TIGR00369 family)